MTRPWLDASQKSSVALTLLEAPEDSRTPVTEMGLREFCAWAWPIVEPGTPMLWNWHLDAICEALEAASRGEIKKLLINVPPGTSKSLMVSVMWCAWDWARDPGLRYLTASYSQDLTIRDNRRVKSIVTDPWYQDSSKFRISSEQAGKVRFDTSWKGWRIATSVGGGGTGEHPDRIIVDDPLKANDARSAVKRKAALTWWRETISSRRGRHPVSVVIMQRLHQDDPSGYLLREFDDWEHICFPMRFSLGGWECPCHKDEADPRDPRTEAGELLWSELYGEGDVSTLEIDLGPYGAAGQLQQRPSPEGGGLFKREWFRIVDAAPADARRLRGWDTAATEDGGDFTVGVRMAEKDGTYYVEDVARGQWGPGSQDVNIKLTAQVDGVACRIREEQEPGSSGKKQIAARLKLLAGYDFEGVTISGDKVVRANPFRAQCEGGNVCLVNGPWVEEYIRELTAFPAGTYDDQVDASSCAFNALALEHHGPGIY